MELKDIKNNLIIKVNENIKDCKEFCCKTHYTKSTGAGGQYYISLYYDNKLVGVSIWRTPNGRLTYKLFNLDSNKTILDLTRFCLDDCMPKNTASYFLSRCIKYIKQNISNIDYLITYADTNEKHKGIIYRATNWLPFGVGGDSIRVYKKLEDGSLFLSSSRWIKNKNIDDFKIVKIEKKFRYCIPLKISRDEFIKQCKNYDKMFKEFKLLNEKNIF